MKKNIKKLLLFVSLGAAILLAIGAGIYSYAYFLTPGHIRHPKIEHYHFRTQIIVAGTSVDFSKKEFQQGYNKSSCNATISKTPVDFHDSTDQMTHIHWDGMTGGEFLKYYGWNFIGGSDDSLGQRYDDNYMPMYRVQRMGNLLPDIPDGANFYVYIGDKNDYRQKAWNDFLHQDLEDFFGKKSRLNQDEQASLLERLFWAPTASAHGGVKDGHSQDETEEELTRINNLIGNVVVFVQKNEPTKEQVQQRFHNLVPLSDSVCGG